MKELKSFCGTDPELFDGWNDPGCRELDKFEPFDVKELELFDDATLEICIGWTELHDPGCLELAELERFDDIGHGIRDDDCPEPELLEEEPELCVETKPECLEDAYDDEPEAIDEGIELFVERLFSMHSILFKLKNFRLKWKFRIIR